MANEISPLQSRVHAPAVIGNTQLIERAVMLLLFAGLLLGSTSQAVLHHSTCPVMVVNKHCEIPAD